MAEVLGHGELSAEQRRCVDTILTSCSALGVLVEGFLDFSRIEAGQLALKRSDFDLYDVVDDTLDLFAHSASVKGIDYGALVESDVPTALRGDPDRLRQVLINLVGNALKFTDKGEVVVRVTLEREESRFAVVRFLVRDSGVGISGPARKALFQPFSGFDRFGGESQSGLGLGLYIAKYFAACMDGEIGVESNAPAAGSSFWFTARLEKRPADAPDVWSAPEALRGLRVLLLHRPSPLREVLAAQLAACGVGVRAEHRLAGGLKELRAGAYAGNPYQVLLIDSGLDHLEIFCLLQSVKKDKDLPAPKIVVLAPMGTGADPISKMLREAKTRLIKPVTQSRLADALLLALEKHGLARSGTLETSVTRIAASRAVTGHREARKPRSDERRILLVEDNPATQQALGQLLRKMGFVVDLADNGVGAVKAAVESRYDVILMDCNLPEMDGPQAAEEIRRRERGHRRTPIICLTGSSQESARDCLDRWDFDDYLSKPAPAREIRAKLERWAPAGKPRGEDNFGLASTLTDPVVMESLRRTFVEDGRTRLEALRRAVSEGDFRAVAQAAHAFYGGCVTLGLSELAEACESLEAAARRGDRDSLAENLGEVESAFGGVEKQWLPRAAAATEGGPAG